MGKNWLVVLIVVIVIVGVLGACSMPGSTPAGQQAGAQRAQQAAALPTYAPGVTPAAATTGAQAGAPAALAPAGQAQAPAAQQAAAPAQPANNQATGASYSAEIAADKSVLVAAQVAGQVLDIKVDVGDHVKTGDVLVQLDSAALDAQRAQALAQLEGANAQLALLKVPAQPQDIAAAQAALDAAGATYTRAVNGPTDEERRQALAALKSAQAAVDVAQHAYDRVKDNPNVGMLPQSLQLQQATLAAEGAQAVYDKLMKGATADQIAGASAQVANARAALQRLKDGAKPEQVQAAEAAVHAAENALYLATLQASKATVTAPVDGVVSRVQSAAGAMAAPGSPLLTLLSNDVRITIAVEETRLGQLAVGQPVRIRVDAYPDKVFGGSIFHIAPELDPGTRTVQVTIKPQDDQHLLRPGMSATAELVNQ